MIASRNFLKDIARLLFWFPLRFFVLLLPFSTLYGLGTLLGWLDYFISGRRRTKKMLKNISEVFDKREDELRAIILRNLQNHSRNVMELIKYPQFTLKSIKKYLSFKGLNILDKELRKDKGVILLTSHFGAKQFLQIGLGLKSYKINQINYHLGDDDLTFIQKRISQRQRQDIEEKIPVKYISADGFLRSAFNCLRRSEVLVIAADGIGLVKYMKSGYLPFDFLGKKMLFPVNSISLAQKTGSPIIPTFVVREREKHCIIIEPPLKAQGQSIEDIFKQFVEVLQKYVFKHPSLWEFWEEFDEDNLLIKSHK